MKHAIIVCTLAIFATLAGAAHAKKIKDVTIRNCTDQKVRICWFNAKDRAKQVARKSWELSANGSMTVKGKTNGKFARLLATPRGDGCGDWNVFSKKLFMKARTGDDFVVKTSKAKGVDVRLREGTSCN